MEDKVIYVANKEKSIAHLLEYVFVSRGGYEVKVLSSGSELLKNLIHRPGVVLTDYESHTNAGSSMGLISRASKLPVIVLSNRERTDKQWAQARMFLYIPMTGFFLDTLIEMVEEAFSRK
jgi:FixJ family two-component response regulator